MQSANKLNLHFVSSIYGSIWEVSKTILPFLENEFNVTKEWKYEIPLKYDILLCHFIDHDVMFKPEIFNLFKTKILIQPIDGTEIRKEYLNEMNKFDLIITPASAGLAVMVSNGVKAPIVVIPNTYGTDLYKKELFTDVEKYVPANKTIFYHESTFHSRKGIEILYESFIKAFSNKEDYDKVALVLKDSAYNSSTFEKNEALKEKAIKLQKTYPFTPDILKFSANLTDDEIKSLWHRTDIYVSFAKIEGFGIPMLRMHLLNKPIICLRNQNSGYNDYLNNDNAYFVDTVQMETEDEFMWLYTEQTNWAIPNITDAIQGLKKCYNDYKEGNHKCLKKTKNDSAFQNQFKKYSVQTIGKQYIKEINSIHEIGSTF